MMAATGLIAVLPLGFLLADWGDIIGALIPIVAILFWVLNQIFGGQQKKAPQRRVQRPQPRPAARPGPQRPAAAGGVNDEVADFLRRAAQKRGGRPPAEAEVVRPAPPKPAPRRVSRVGEVIATAEVIEEKRPRPRAAAPARKPLASRHVEELPSVQSSVEQADERMEQHLHSVFDHQVGSLESARRAAPAQAAAPAVTPSDVSATPLSAAGFAALLSGVDGARQAVVLSEILQRPEQRW